MEDLAERHGGTFDGWDITGRMSLNWVTLDDLPS